MSQNKAFWKERYLNGTTGWDIGQPAPALARFIDGLEDLNTRILIPGAGRGYEAEYLLTRGFRNFVVLDIAREPLAALRGRVPATPPKALVEADFFAYDDGPFDLILEHTFFCALEPSMRPQYAEHMLQLLAPGGTLAGLFFDFPLTDQGPPFGGSEAEYRELFGSVFHFHRLERNRHSIAPRKGSELFFIFEKK